ncbi:MAG: DUF1109 domain-containing protein [Pseudomonadota bacterium]
MTMEKQANREDLIASLTQELEPVSRIKPRDGAFLIGFATLVAGIACIAIFEFWSGMITGEASAFYWITNLLLLVLGAASTSALISSALPKVGARGSAPFWSAAMLGVVPIAALITITALEANHDHAAHVQSVWNDAATWYWECAAYGSMAGFLVAVAAVLFLRRGAPVSLERAGWLTGLASGSLGALAYNITCPLDTIAHVGIWHTAPVLIWAFAARIAVPPLIRW